MPSTVCPQLTLLLLRSYRYGNFNLLTNEWTDGLIAKLVRDACDDVAHGSTNKKWNCFDGKSNTLSNTLCLPSTNKEIIL